MERQETQVSATATKSELKSTKNDSKTTSKGSKFPQMLAAGIACLSSFTNGMMYTWPAVAQPLLQSAESPLGLPPMTDNEASWFVSIMYLVATLTMAPWAMVVAFLSRKTLGYILGALYGLQWILLVAAPGTIPLYVARALGGIACAGMFYFTPTYVREISDDSTRGTAGTLMALEFNAGVLVMYGLGAILSYQSLLLFCLVCTCIFEVSFWRMPETPVYLLSMGRTDEATRSLQWLRGRGTDVTTELRALEASVKRRDADGPGSLRSLLSDRATVRAFFIAMAMCASQPLCGFFVVLSYAVSIFAEAGTPLSPSAAATVTGALLVLGSAASTWLVDRAGRRPLFLTSLATVAAALAVLGGYEFAKSSGVDVSNISWLPVVGLALFMGMVTLAITTLAFVVITEIFLPEVQKLVINLGGMTILCFGFLATKFFPSIVAFLGLYGCYWLFSIISVFILVFLFIVFPETKGRPLDSIRRELAGGKEIPAQIANGSV